MATAATERAFASDEEALLYTQRLRKRLIEENLMFDGKLPNDEKMQGALLMTLRDMDKQALSLKKIASDAGNADLDRQAAMMIATINKGVTSNPFAASPGSRAIPDPDSQIPDLELADQAELGIGISTETYDDFSAKVGD